MVYWMKSVIMTYALHFTGIIPGRCQLFDRLLKTSHEIHCRVWNLLTEVADNLSELLTWVKGYVMLAPKTHDFCESDIGLCFRYEEQGG